VLPIHMLLPDSAGLLCVHQSRFIRYNAMQAVLLDILLM
jgi:hypothetical protein